MFNFKTVFFTISLKKNDAWVILTYFVDRMVETVKPLGSNSTDMTVLPFTPVVYKAMNMAAKNVIDNESIFLKCLSFFIWFKLHLNMLDTKYAIMLRLFACAELITWE